MNDNLGFYVTGIFVKWCLQHGQDKPILPCIAEQDLVSGGCLGSIGQQGVHHPRPHHQLHWDGQVKAHHHLGKQAASLLWQKLPGIGACGILHQQQAFDDSINMLQS
jgi:hypothetical protein